MELGLHTPVVTMLPRAHAPWEATGTIDDIARVAEAADRLGFHHLTCCEHVAVPASVAEARGSRYWDPLATFGYLAARTQRIRLTTSVLVLGYHHPLEIVKRYGTLDQISGGRLVLGVGVGTLEEEFALLGAPFDDRGARADDAIRALRASLSSQRPVYDGEYHSYRDVIVDPCAQQPRVPIWVGGRTRRSLRRAVSLGDGWCPFAVSPATAAAWLATVDVPDGFEVVLAPERLLDPLGDPTAAEDALGRLAAAGVTVAAPRLRHSSVDHLVEQLEALVEISVGVATGS